MKVPFRVVSGEEKDRVRVMMKGQVSSQSAVRELKPYRCSLELEEEKLTKA